MTDKPETLTRKEMRALALVATGAVSWPHQRIIITATGSDELHDVLWYMEDYRDYDVWGYGDKNWNIYLTPSGFDLLANAIVEDEVTDDVQT